MRGFFSRWACFTDTTGTIAIQFAVALPVLLSLASIAADYSLLSMRHAQLQSAVDGAALSAVHELSLAGQNRRSIAANLARTMVMHEIGDSGSLVVNSEAGKDNSLRVTARETVKNTFGLFEATSEIEVTAVAQMFSSKLCMIALETKNAAAVSLEKNSRLTGKGCTIVSNSKDPDGIEAADNALVDADVVCSAGGVKRNKNANFENEPITDCPVVDDPLVNRAPPSVGLCDHTKLEIKGGSQTLMPGVYCDGLKVTEAAQVTLSPGTYIITGDKLKVDKGASLSGEGVGFYLAGKDSSFEFAYDSTISLSASTSGDMAGILIFDDRNGKWDKHRIYSNNARTLLGTIYLPNGSLYIDSQKPIADKSAYTVLVTRTLELHDGPNLVLNSDYESSDVPLPKGVGTVSKVMLIE
jgi:Flp pilus assembly protein TadG